MEGGDCVVDSLSRLHVLIREAEVPVATRSLRADARVDETLAPGGHEVGGPVIHVAPKTARRLPTGGHPGDVPAPELRL